MKKFIRKKTYKPIVLMFWIEGNVIPLCSLAHFLLLFDLSIVPLSMFERDCTM